MNQYNIRDLLSTMKLIGTVLGVMMFLAIFPLPYGYYSFLRVVTFFGATANAYITYVIYERPTGPTWIFVVIALIWNPFLPIFMARGSWLFLNLIASGLFLLFRPDPNALT